MKRRQWKMISIHAITYHRRDQLKSTGRDRMVMMSDFLSGRTKILFFFFCDTQLTPRVASKDVFINQQIYFASIWSRSMCFPGSIDS